MKTNPPFIYSYKFSTIARTNEKTLHPSLSEVNDFVSYIVRGGGREVYLKNVMVLFILGMRF